MQSSQSNSKFSFLEKINIKPNTTLLLSTVAIISFMILGSTVLAVQYKLLLKPNPKIVTENEVLGVKYDLYNPNIEANNQNTVQENATSVDPFQKTTSGTRLQAENQVEQNTSQPESKLENKIKANESLNQENIIDSKKTSESMSNQNINKLEFKKNSDQNLKTLTPQDLNQILFDTIFENTSSSDVSVSVTGNLQADQYIQKKAQDRGYKLWPQADESKLETVIDSIKLQPKARDAFLKMQEKAKSEGVILGLTSGYRSQIEQNLLFKTRFESLQMAELGGYYTPAEILNGDADVMINKILSITAPPGHSRHHTGYTVDLADLSPDNTTTVFNGSKAYLWMSDNNFKNARSFGFLPSYPKGGTDFGPEPEAWEFVWVGEKAI